jgi:hypothetical protein
MKSITVDMEAMTGLAACRRTRDLLQSAWTGLVFMQIIGTYDRYASQICIKTISSQTLFATI